MADLDAVIPLDVAARWIEWLDGGQSHRVRADLAQLMADAKAAGLKVATPRDPPSSADPPISTR